MEFSRTAAERFKKGFTPKWQPITVSSTMAIASIVLGSVGLALTSTGNYGNISSASSDVNKNTTAAKDGAFGVGRAFAGTAVGLASAWLLVIVGLLVCFALSTGGCGAVVDAMLNKDSTVVMFGAGIALVCTAALGNVLLHNTGYTVTDGTASNKSNQMDSVWVASVAILCLTIGSGIGATMCGRSH